MPDQSPGNSITLFIFTYYEGCVPRRVQMVPDLSAAHTGIEYARPGGQLSTALWSLVCRMGEGGLLCPDWDQDLIIWNIILNFWLFELYELRIYFQCRTDSQRSYVEKSAQAILTITGDQEDRYIHCYKCLFISVEAKEFGVMWIIFLIRVSNWDPVCHVDTLISSSPASSSLS